MNRTQLAFTYLFLIVFAFSCKKDDETPLVIEPEILQPNLPTEYYNYANQELPEYVLTNTFFDLVDDLPEDNPITDEGATLGRVLFYDTQMSVDGTISCSSCHHQERAFADFDAASIGLDEILTPRNSMALFNLRYNRQFFWDERVNTLENQVLEPIQHPEEHGMDLFALTERLSSIEYYPSLFEAAFGDGEITSDRISRALAQFIRSMYSWDSKYDQGYYSDFSNFTDQELLGKDLFFNGETRCNQCHTTVNFYFPDAMINGLDVEYADGGVGEDNVNSPNHGRFRVVSLRNLSFTGPYMHDGRFETLEEVMNHYNGNIQPHPYLDDRLAENFIIGGTPIDPDLSEEEVEAMIAFLRTLDDYSFIADPKFSNPF